MHQPDKELSAIIGDVLGNLRSALDYFVVALVLPITGDAHGIGFPFADNEKGFKGEVTKSSLSHVSDAIRQQFINEVQAYEDGFGHSLWVLNKLRNIDKHRYLVTSVSVSGVVMSFKSRSSGAVFKDCTFAVKTSDGGTLIDVPINDIKLTDKPRPTFEVKINEPPCPPDSPVVGFLKGLASDVGRTLDAFDDFYKIAAPPKSVVQAYSVADAKSLGVWAKK